MKSHAATVHTLVSVVYVSYAVRPWAPEELSKLLDQSRERNLRNDITGMLLCRNGDFMQLLEGPASNVDRLLKRLQYDKRHSGMIVLTNKPIVEREFGQWQMAFRDLDSADLGKLEGYSPFMDWAFDAPDFQKRPDLSYKLLMQFKNRVG